METIRSYLAGEWRDGKTVATLVNPATEEPIATAGVAPDLGGALRHARDVGGPNLRSLTFAARGDLLEKLSRALHAEREPLIAGAMANGGCTRSDAKFDVDGAIAVLAHYAEVGRALGDRRILPDGEGIQLGRSPRFWGQHIYVPRAGVAILINAFNFPAWGFAEKAACAWIAGVPVVTKPATSTALTAYEVVRAAIASNLLPGGALGFVGGPASDLLDHVEGQDLIAFTGSAATAMKLRSHPRVVAESVPVNVEADSLNAVVLGPDVELGSETMAMFLREVSKEVTQKTGQKCTATRRILVPSPRVDDVVAELGARFAEIIIGNPADESVRMGPIATAQQLADVRAGTARLLDEADPVFGDPNRPVDGVGSPRGKGFFFPIVLLRARDSEQAHAIHAHEVFGPVATILPYSGRSEDAARLVRRGGGGLVASVFSDDRAFSESVTLAIAAHHGRVYLGSEKVAEHAMGAGLVLPQCVHGGPGRAGGGEELGGDRGVKRFMHRAAIQGSRPAVEALTGTKKV
jgi:oxepin-CoA hydrolase/3-oxo-5,6-dehydrosuberyl-CoA semialdehyde dehydrogenase